MFPLSPNIPHEQPPGQPSHVAAFIWENLCHQRNLDTSPPGQTLARKQRGYTVCTVSNRRKKETVSVPYSQQYGRIVSNRFQSNACGRKVSIDKRRINSSCPVFHSNMAL